MSMFKFDRRTLIRSYMGNYNYIRLGETYAEENFEIFENYENKHQVFASNFVARLDNGEFLNISTLYELTDSYSPVKVITQRSLGTNEVEESFIYNTMDNKLHYTFQNKDFVQAEDLPLSKKIFIMAPTFLTKCLFALSRKYEASARIPYVVMRSYNLWQFEKLPQEEHIFVEYETSKMKVRNIQGEEYSTFDINVYQSDTWKNEGDAEVPITFHITKDNAIPIHAILEDGTEVSLTRLRKFQMPEHMLA